MKDDLSIEIDTQEILNSLFTLKRDKEHNITGIRKAKPHGFLEVLAMDGYQKIYPNKHDTEAILVRVEENIVSISTPQQCRDTINKYLKFQSTLP